LGAAALAVASDEVTGDEWRRYVANQRIDERFPEIQAIGFAEQVEARELPALVERVRADGATDFAVHPPGDRLIYTPVIFSEPPTVAGRRMIGHDLFEDLTGRRSFAPWREPADADQPPAGRLGLFPPGRSRSSASTRRPSAMAHSGPGCAVECRRVHPRRIAPAAPDLVLSTTDGGIAFHARCRRALG
jgi:hypothetical protein